MTNNYFTKINLQKFVIIILFSGLTCNHAVHAIIGVDENVSLLCVGSSSDQIMRCSTTFENKIKKLKFRINQNYVKQQVCCAMNQLHECIFNAIGEECNDSDKNMTKLIVYNIVSSINWLHEHNHECKVFPSRKFKMSLIMFIITIIVVVVKFLKR